MISGTVTGDLFQPPGASVPLTIHIFAHLQFNWKEVGPPRWWQQEPQILSFRMSLQKPMGNIMGMLF